MTLKGDYASIAATSSGVAGTITVPSGARFLGINLNWNIINAIVTIVEVTASGLPQPLRFTPCMGAQSTGVGAVTAIGQTPLIDLRGLSMGSGNTLTITVTSNVNVTVVVGLMWVE